MQFLDTERYQLRFRDAGGNPSPWYDGQTSRDEVFPEAKAFLLKHYFTDDRVMETWELCEQHGAREVLAPFTTTEGRLDAPLLGHLVAARPRAS